MSYKLLTFKPNINTPFLTGTNSDIDNPTVEDLITLNGLDQWEAEKIPNHNEFSDNIEDSYHVRKRYLDDRQGKFYPIFSKCVGEKYKVMQYQEGLKWLEPFLMEDLLKVDSTLLLYDGAKFSVFLDINLEEEVLPQDTVQRNLLLALSHDGQQRGFYFTDIRPVCANTLAMAKAEGLRNPSKNLVLDESNPQRSLDTAKRMIDLTTATFRDKSIPKYKAYANLHLEASQTDYIIRTVSNVPLGNSEVNEDSRAFKRYLAIKEAYVESPGMDLIQGETGWKVLNAVTNHTQYLNKDESKAFVADKFGSTANRLRQQTIQMLEDLLPKTAIPV